MPPTDVNQALKFRSGGVGHGAYDLRIKVIAKMLKKSDGWGRGVRVKMNKELKLLLKLQNKVEGVRSRGGVGWGEGQSGHERRIEVIVKMQTEEKKVGVGSSLGVGEGA